MKQIIILWLAAAVITYLTGYLRSVTSDEFPVTGTIGVAGEKVTFMFDKLHRSNDPYTVSVRSDVEGVEGIVYWRSNAKTDHWNSTGMKYEKNLLTADIEADISSGRVEYYVELQHNGKQYRLPSDGSVVGMKLLGGVPQVVMIFHYLFLFGGLILAVRTGLDYFRDNEKIKKLSLFTLIFLGMNTLMFAPLKRSFELSAINNNIPSIELLFELQPVLLLIIWIVFVIFVFTVKSYKKYALASGILSILIFLFI